MDGHSTSSASVFGSAGASNVTSSKSATPNDAAILQRLRESGVPSEFLERGKKGVADYVKKYISRLSEVIAALVPGPDDVHEVSSSGADDVRGSGTCEEFESHFRDALQWVQWIMLQGEPQAVLTTVGQETGLCGALLGSNDVAYRCRTCEKNPSSVFCVLCFQNSDHATHDYSMERIWVGGFCDCGDDTAWKQSRFCSRHSGPKQMSLLPSSLVETATPVMKALISLWVKRLKAAEELAGNMTKKWDDQSVHEKVACQLSLVCIEMMLEFCSFSGMLAFTANIVGDRSLELLDTLMSSECYLSNSCVSCLHELLQKLLMDTNFKYTFARIFMSCYPIYLLDAIKDITSRGETSTRTKYCEHGIINTFSEKIFVDQTLTLKLVTESGLLNMLLHTFKELFCACVGEDGRILVGNGSVLRRITGDIRIVMNYLEVSHYVAQRRPKLARALVHLLAFIQGMYPYRRMTGIHAEKEAEDAYSLEFEMRYFHHLLVAGAASSNLDARFKDDLVFNPQSCFQASLDNVNGGTSCNRIVYALGSLLDSNSWAGDSEIGLGLEVDRRDAVLSADSIDRTSTELNLQQRGEVANGMVFIAGMPVPASLVSLVDECVLVLDQWLALDLSKESMKSGQLATDTSSIQGYRRSHRWRGQGDRGVRASSTQTTGGRIRERLRSSKLAPFEPQGWPEAAQDQSVVDSNAGNRASDMDVEMEVACEGLEIRAEKWWVGSEGLASSTILDQIGEDIEWPAMDFDVSQQGVSFHIPIHRMLALLFHGALHLHSVEKEKFSGKGKSVSSQGERLFLEEVLPPKYRVPGFAAFVMEHPLRLQVLYAQFQAGMWRCNNYAITKLYNVHHTLYWCDESVELDLFLLQCCSVLSPCEIFLERILTRFSLTDFFNLSLWDPYKYQITLAQELLNFLIKLASERGFCGLTEKEALRRELVQRLALKDATRSYLVDALPIRFQDSKHLEECLDAVAIYCNPSEIQEGKYVLREERWCELDLYYPRWNSGELQSAMKRYLTACGAPAVFLQLPSWSQPFAALQGLGRLIISSRVHDMLRSIFFHIAYSPSMEQLQLQALHLLALALDFCKFQNELGVYSRADHHFSDPKSPVLGFNNASSNNVVDHPALLLRCTERVDLRSADATVMPEPQSMLSLLVLLWRKQVDEARSHGFGDLIMKLLRSFAELDKGCLHEIESLAPEILGRVSVGTTLEACGVGDIYFKDDISIYKSDERRSIVQERQAAAMNIELPKEDALLKALINSKARIESCLLEAQNLDGHEDVPKDECQAFCEIDEINISAREAADGKGGMGVTLKIKHNGNCSHFESLFNASGDLLSASKTLEDAVVQTIQTLHSLRSLRLRERTHGSWVPVYWLAVPWSNFSSFLDSPALPWIVLGVAEGFLHSTEQELRVQPNRTLSKKVHAIAHLENAYQLILRELHAYQRLLTEQGIEHAQYQNREECNLRLLRCCIFLLHHVYDSAHLHIQAAEFARLYTAYECLEANLDKKIRRRISIAKCYFKANIPDKAAEAAREALTIIDDQRIEGTSLKLYQIRAANLLPPEEALTVLEHVLAWKERSRGVEGELSMESQEMLEGVGPTLCFYIRLGRFNEAVKLVHWFDAIADKLKGGNEGGWELWQTLKMKLFTELGENAKVLEVERALQAEWAEGTTLSPVGLILVAHYLEMTDDNDSALEVLDECNSLCGGDLEAHGMSLPFCSSGSVVLLPHIYQNRGRVYYKVGKYEEALRDLEKGVIMAKKIFGLDLAQWKEDRRTLLVTNYLRQAQCLIRMGRSEEAQARVNDSYEFDLEKYEMGLGYTELMIYMHARNHEKVELDGVVHFLECAAIQSGLGQGMKAEWVSLLENTEMRNILRMIECSSYMNARTRKQPFWRPLVWAERSQMRLFMFEKKNCDFDRFDQDDEYAQSIVTQVAESCINLNTAIIAYSYDARTMNHFHTYLVTKVIEDGKVSPTLTCSAKGTKLSSNRDCGVSWDLNLVTDAREAITTHKDPRPHLATLYHLLVPDLPDHIDTLLFAPQGELSKVPFAALYDSRDDKFLIEKKCVGVIPSFRVLQRCFDQQALFEKNFMKLRPPFLAGNPKPMGRSMAPLPGAAKEAEAVAKLWSRVEPVVREHMTKAAVVDGLQTSSLVLIATHGDSMKDDPSDGTLVMQATSGSSSDRQDSEILTGSEISDLEVRAGLVILSACKTGDGTVTREGLLGPGRAVLHAGAPTVITTLWSVDDVGTKELIVDTMREFRQGEKTVNQCLQLAMQKMIKDGKSIYEWASLCVLGSPTLRWPLEGDKAGGFDISKLSGEIHDIKVGEGRIGGESDKCRPQLLRWITSGSVMPALEVTHGPTNCLNHLT